MHWPEKTRASINSHILYLHDGIQLPLDGGGLVLGAVARSLLGTQSLLHVLEQKRNLHVIEEKWKTIGKGFVKVWADDQKRSVKFGRNVALIMSLLLLYLGRAGGARRGERGDRCLRRRLLRISDARDRLLCSGGHRVGVSLRHDHHNKIVIKKEHALG